jgi:hypothetical protein
MNDNILWVLTLIELTLIVILQIVNYYFKK